MKFLLSDGTYAHLHAVTQKSSYGQSLLRQTENTMTDILRMAKSHVPSTWPPAPMVLIGFDESELADLARQGKLPAFLCIGDFVSYRIRKDGSKKAAFLRVVWLQEELAPHLSKKNETALAALNWDGDVPPPP